jgi:cell division septation protein DedD
VARDFAKGGSARGKSTRGGSRRKPAARSAGNRSAPGGWKWYSAGVLTGVFLSFLVYLGTLPPSLPGGGSGEPQGQAVAESAPPKPRFDFYKMLPDQSIQVEVEPAEVARPRSEPPAERFLLQAGSFRQREDADARRAQLLLLGLEPRIEEANGDNGRWYRVYLGPFDSKSTMARARSLTAAQGIDTLLLKRTRP